MSSIHKTAVMIRPAIGTITLSLMFFMKLYTSPFQPIGVFPTSVAITPTLSFISKNMDSRFALIPPSSISLKNSVSLSKIPNIDFLLI